MKVSGDMKIFKNVSTLVAVFCVFSAGAAEKRWRGTDAENPTLASVDANWVDADGNAATAPTAEDDVVLDAASADRPMTWDLDNGVRSWTQSEYAGTVTFLTGTSVSYSGKTYTCRGVGQPDGTTAFAVSGDVVLSSGVWTHQTTPAMTSTSKELPLWKKGFGVYRLIVSVGGNCTIGAGAKIDVDSKGFEKDGPGYRNSSASHGGFGGYNYYPTDDPAAVYGSVRRPVSLGTGRASRGGGAVRLTVAGDLVLNGAVSAIGLRTGNYPGSGGSVWITARSLSGTGSVCVDGGAGTTSAGCGGGGRAAVYLTGEASDFGGFASRITAKNVNVYGTCGTVYLETAADAGDGTLVLRSGSTTETHEGFRKTRLLCTPLKADPDERTVYSDVLLDGWTNLGVLNGVTVTVASVTGGMSSRNRITLYGGTLKCEDGGDGFVLSGAMLLTSSAASDLIVGETGTGTLHVAADAMLMFDVPTTLSGSLVVTGTVTHASVVAAATNRIDLTVSGDMTVAKGGAIDVSNKGWGGRGGPGAAVSAAGGAVHAGSVPGSAKVVYGDPLHPVGPGSGGGVGAGGGSVRLRVAGTFTLDGSIKAYSSNNSGGGCGSGGSVWITAAHVAGTGSLDAKGGSYLTGGDAVAGAAGSGGRVSVVQTAGDKNLGDWALSLLTVAGGKSTGSDSSGGGTIYWEKSSDGTDRGRLYAAGSSPSACPYLPTSDTDAAVFAGVRLSVSAGSRLTLLGDLTVREFSLPADGTLLLDGHVLTVGDPAKTQVASVLGTVDPGDAGRIDWRRRRTVLSIR